MSIASQLINKPQNVHHRSRGLAASAGTSRAWLCTEALWMACTFLLFIILGPFAAIAVVPAVLSLSTRQQDGLEPEPEAAAAAGYPE